MDEMVELRHDGHAFVDNEGNRYMYDQATEEFLQFDESGRVVNQD